MNDRTVQTKFASGSSQASVTFSADNGRWEVGFLHVIGDVAAAAVVLTQGTTVVGTMTIGAATKEFLAGDFAVMVGTDKAALTLKVDNPSGTACQILATAALNDRAL